MEELQELIKYLKDNGYAHLKINPDLLIGIIEYFASKQEPKQCTLTDVSQQRELLEDYQHFIDWNEEHDRKASTSERIESFIASNCG